MKAQLVVVYGKPRNTIKSLPVGDCLIGRGDECQVRANSPLVSRQHCLVRVTKESAVLRDLGSTNGTLVNGKRILNERTLEQGDLVQIGPVVFEFRDVSLAVDATAATTCVELTAKVATSELPAVEVSEPLSVRARALRSEDTRHQPA